MKNVSIGIDHVAVSGLPSGPRNSAAIGRGVESALGRILTERGLSALAARDLSRISLPDLHLPPGASDRQIAEAVAAQMRKLDTFHTFDRFTNPVADALAERLAALAPMPDARVFLTSGGSEAVETAVKLARLAQFRAGHPGRTVIVSRRPSYHGVTYAAMTATGPPGASSSSRCAQSRR